MNCRGFLKNNFSYIVFAIMTVFLVVFFQFIYLCEGDDKIYSTIAKSSLSDILYFMGYHYDFCNGRTLMHLLLIFFLKFDAYLWRIVCPLIFSLLVFLSSMFISSDTKSFKKALLLFSVSSFFISVNVFESTLFWVTGSFNYVFPFVFLIITLLLIKYDRCRFLVPLLGFLCGATTEQCGMISIFSFAMYLFYETVVLKNRLNKTILFTILTSVIGLLTVVLAPSVSARTYESSDSFFDRLSMIFFNFWFKFEGMAAIIFLLLIVVFIELISVLKSKKARALLAVLFALEIALYVLQFMYIPIISAASQYFFPAIFLIGIAAVCIHSIIIKKNFLPLFSVLLGMGAQFMMAVSQRFSCRTTLPSIFCFIFFAVTVLLNNDLILSGAKKINFVKGVLATVTAIVIIINAGGYIELAQRQASLVLDGKCATSLIDRPQSREDVENIIALCEDVRLGQMNAHKN